MFKRIFVPLDGSARAESAIPVAACIARAYGAAITLLRIAETPVEYGSYVAPTGETCEWCGKTAVHQLTALGGVHHNEGGFFCSQCSRAFVRAVASSLSREVRPEAEAAVR